MEFVENYAVVALTGVAGKLVFSSVRSWWNRKTLRELYIQEATRVQNEHEIIAVAESSDDDTVTERHLTDEQPKRATKHRGSFRNFLVQKGQTKFGCPARNEANRLVVRKYLHDVCCDSGLIARHINDHLDIATELVFVPSRAHLISLALAHTELSRTRRSVRDDLGGPRATLA